MSLTELLAREAEERERQRIEERLFRERNARNRYEREISTHTDWLREWNANARDIEAWVAALEDIKQVSLARVADIESTIAATPETSDDPFENYNVRRIRGQHRAELATLRDRLDAIDGKGRMANTDLPELLAAKGIRPHEGQTSLTRGPGRVPLPRARKALDALRAEIARREAELAEARAALAALDTPS